MRKFFLSIPVIICFLAACSATEKNSSTIFIEPTIDPSLQILEYFPLKQGAYWVYEGTIRYTIPNSSDVAEKEISWKMEVTNVIQRNSIVGYEMLGAPWDLAWYEEDKQPSKYGIIQAGGKFYRTSFETIYRLLDDNDALLALVDENQIFLDIPLIAGKKFCDTLSLTRADGMYCWIVGDASLVTEEILGVSSSEPLVEFPIFQGTMPDSSRFHFIPGVGISQYSYRHSGTVSEANVRLVEYYSGE